MPKGTNKDKRMPMEQPVCLLTLCVFKPIQDPRCSSTNILPLPPWNSIVADLFGNLVDPILGGALLLCLKLTPCAA